MIINAVVATGMIGSWTPADAMPLLAQPRGVVHHHRRGHERHRHRLGHGRRHERDHDRRRVLPNLFGVTSRMMAAAARVSRCEEDGDWHFVGASFDGGIGWTPGNWAHFRKPSWPRFMHDAPPHMQANALFRFVRYYGIAMPDQNGTCAGY